MATSRQMTAFEEVNLFFDQASDRLKLSDGLREMLRRPWRELQVQVPVRMDDGHIEVFTGYRVQHNGARGPYKGGVRYHPEADLGGSARAGCSNDLEDSPGGPSLRGGQGKLSRLTLPSSASRSSTG